MNNNNSVESDIEFIKEENHFTANEIEKAKVSRETSRSISKLSVDLEIKLKLTGIFETSFSLTAGLLRKKLYTL